MAMKGSDEQLPLSMVKEKAQGVGSSFFSGGVINVAESSACLKRLYSIFNTTRK